MPVTTLAPVRLLLVDDNDIFRSGLRSLLSEYPDIEVVGCAANGSEALALVGPLQPDVVLMDVNMPVQGGISATQDITARRPEVRVILLTGLAAGGWAYDPRDLGAWACLSKSSGVAEIVTLVMTAAGRHVSGQRHPHFPLGNDKKRDLLTMRELEILALLGNGYQSHEIAGQLELEPKTVRNHISNIYLKLGVHGRAQAVLRAARDGLLDDIA